MKILVIGAHSGTGRLVVEVARERGHDVTAFEGDVLDAARVRGAVKGQDAVVSLVGPRKDSPPDLCSRGTRNILDAMQEHGVKRLVVVTGANIGHGREHLGLVYRAIQSLIPRERLDDRRKSEAMVQQSDRDWTLVRPTRLTDGPLHERVRAGSDLHIGALAHLSRADVAQFIVHALEDGAWVRQGLALAR